MMAPSTSKCRGVAGVLAAVLLAGLTGCSSRAINAQSPPPYGGGPAPMRPSGAPGPNVHQGLSTKQKLVLLAGAAAVYYLYKRHQNTKQEGPNGRYYLSKNGRVYYRDLRTGAYRWVDPPQQPLAITPEEYEQYVGQQAPATGRVVDQAPAGWPGNRAYAGAGG